MKQPKPTDDDAQKHHRPKQAISLPVTVVIVIMCLMTISFTMTNRLLSSAGVGFVRRRRVVDFRNGSASLGQAPGLRTVTEEGTTQPMTVDPLAIERKVRQMMKDRFGDEQGVNPLSKEKYVVFRAIGNDLPPRHALGQTYDNVEFILKNEQDSPNLDKRWFVNRIIDMNELFNIVNLLIRYNSTFVIDYLDWPAFLHKTDYRLHGFRQLDVLRSHIFRQYSYSNFNERRLIFDAILKERNQMIIQNNPARNKMIELGISAGAEYILPWDGNCFLTSLAWKSIKQSIELANETQKYFYTPMNRVTNNSILITDLESEDSNAKLQKKAIEEPQLIFRRDASQRFNESIAYGCRPKVDMLVKLGIPGNWTNVDISLVCLALTPYKNMSVIVNQSESASSPSGWVARLFSGKKLLEKKGAIIKRGFTRTDGVENVISKTSLTAARIVHDFIGNQTTLFYNQTTLHRNLLAYRDGTAPPELEQLLRKLFSYADEELSQHPNQIQSVSSNYTTLFIARYTIVHTFAGLFSGDEKYFLRARILIVNLFLDRFTRVPTGVSSNIPPGIVVCMVLDAVKLLSTIGILKDYEVEAIVHWSGKRSKYYDTGNNNMRFRDQYFSSRVNATMIEINAAAASAMATDGKRLLRAVSWARPRLWMQYPYGEVKKSKKERSQGDSRQDGVFGVFAWTLLAQISKQIGVDIWTFGQLPIHGGIIVLRDAIRNFIPHILRRSDNDWDENDLSSHQVIPNDLANSLFINPNASILLVRPETQKVLAEFVFWLASAEYQHVRGGFWGDKPPQLNSEQDDGFSDFNVAKSVYVAPHGMEPIDDDDHLLVPPFWNVAM